MAHATGLPPTAAFAYTANTNTVGMPPSVAAATTTTTTSTTPADWRVSHQLQLARPAAVQHVTPTATTRDGDKTASVSEYIDALSLISLKYSGGPAATSAGSQNAQTATAALSPIVTAPSAVVVSRILPPISAISPIDSNNPLHTTQGLSSVASTIKLPSLASLMGTVSPTTSTRATTAQGHTHLLPLSMQHQHYLQQQQQHQQHMIHKMPMAPGPLPQNHTIIVPQAPAAGTGYFLAAASIPSSATMPLVTTASTSQPVSHSPIYQTVAVPIYAPAQAPLHYIGAPNQTGSHHPHHHLVSYPTQQASLQTVLVQTAPTGVNNGIPPAQNPAHTLHPTSNSSQMTIPHQSSPAEPPQYYLQPYPHQYHHDQQRPFMSFSPPGAKQLPQAPSTQSMTVKRFKDMSGSFGSMSMDKMPATTRGDPDTATAGNIASSNRSAIFHNVNPTTASRRLCHICGHMFTRPSSLATHMNTHMGLRPFMCPYPKCNKRFSVMSNMRRHARSAHIGFNGVSPLKAMESKDDTMMQSSTTSSEKEDEGDSEGEDIDHSTSTDSSYSSSSSSTDSIIIALDVASENIPV